MIELFNFALAPASLIPTTLLIFILIYWITVFAGLLDVDFLHLDIPDLDANADITADVDGHFEVSWLNQILAFFNLRQIPVMVFLSFVVLSFWFLALFVNYNLGIESFFISFILLIPNFILSLFVAKFLTMPFLGIFGKLNSDIQGSSDMLGKMGTVKITLRKGKAGQVEIVHENAHLLIIAHADTDEEIPVGTRVLVIDYVEQEKSYLVEPYKN